MPELHFGSGKNAHGCNLPRGIRVEDLDDGKWTCLACGAVWRIEDIYWRDPGMRAFEHQKYTGHAASRQGTEYLYTWRLVSKGKRPVNVERRARKESAGHKDVQYRVEVEVVIGNLSKRPIPMTSEVQVRVRHNRPRLGGTGKLAYRTEEATISGNAVYRKRLIAAPGDIITVMCVPKRIEPRVYQSIVIRVNGHPIDYAHRSDNQYLELSYVLPEIKR